MKRGFASDNNAGVPDAVLKSMEKVNQGHVTGYGDDEYSREAVQILKQHFGDKADVYLVFSGTGANVLSLTAATNSYNSVICAETSHIFTDECGSPEKFTGCKLLSVPSDDGKLTIEGIRKHMYGIGFEHHSQPKVISISQPTELGTVYSIDEIIAITSFAHSHKLMVHMDGARLSNAVVSISTTFKEIALNAGIDMLSFGGTKNGLMYGEAIIFFNKRLSADFKYIRKQGMQLASKMRFMAAQFMAFFDDNLWYRNARHANKMAKVLEGEVKKIPGIKIVQKVQSNVVFAIIPGEIIEKLQEKYFFYVWDESKSLVRWMTSFDTTEKDIIDFTTCLKELMNNLYA